MDHPWFFLPNLFCDQRANDFLTQLKSDINWQQPSISIMGKSIPIPRLQAYYGEKPYTYSKLTLPARNFPEVVQTIMTEMDKALQQHHQTILDQNHNWTSIKSINKTGHPSNSNTKTGHPSNNHQNTNQLDIHKDESSSLNNRTSIKFNSVLLNWYRDGRDSMGWHADNEKELGPTPWVASVSLGEKRRFKLRHNKSKHVENIELTSGSLFIMYPICQKQWQHSVPKTTKALGDRISLTFRLVRDS